MNTLDKLLEILQLATSAAQGAANLAGAPDAAAGAAIAAQIEAVVKKGLEAYEAHAGAPLDLSLLHRIEPVD